MCDTLERSIPTRRLRSSDTFVLNVPRYNLKSYGGRAFSVAAPRYKVNPNVNVCMFKSKLKTYLFKYSYY